MRHHGRITAEAYTEIDYHQFSQSTTTRVGLAIAGILTWPLTIPLALLSRLSDFIFITCSQFFAMFPYALGLVFRYEFYRFALKKCGKNVMIGFGTVFIYRDVEIGDNVLIGMFNTIHHCDFGSYVLTAEGCRFLSGARYHRYERLDVPMALQGGELRRIQIEDDVWVGANAVVMGDIGTGSVVAAGAVVTSAVHAKEIVGGVPARVIGGRDDARSNSA